MTISEHLSQPNKKVNLSLDFELFRRMKPTNNSDWEKESIIVKISDYEIPYCYELEPTVTSNGIFTWRSVQGDIGDELLFEKWCTQKKSRDINLYDAIEVFKDDIYSIALEMSINGDNSLLDKIKFNNSNKNLNVEGAKNFPMEELMRRYGIQNRLGRYLCPFHNDRNPSMSIHKQTNRYKCWSCDASGDTIDFVMKMQKCKFAEAVNILT